MKENFSVPKEFEAHSKALFEKDSITKREFVDFCLLALKLIDKHWDQRQGMVYSITGAWLKYDNIEEDDLLDQIGGKFGTLELPDHIVGGNEKGVWKEWQQVRKLVLEADKKFPK